VELIARGRDADIFALDDQRVLRRYRDGGIADAEPRLMTFLAAAGYPVPAVYDVDGSDMVLERLSGPTLTEELARRPWRYRSLGRLLGGLHDRLHAIRAPEWLPRRFPAASDDRVLHLDLHPTNVMLTPRGPVVIDWRNAAAGDPSADLAMTLVLVGSAEVPGRINRWGRGLLLREIGAGCAADPAARMSEVVQARLADPNVTAAEAARLRVSFSASAESPR
jgi:Ser/Thr protein kinase RdoA (MazF antagonist)